MTIKVLSSRLTFASLILAGAVSAMAAVEAPPAPAKATPAPAKIPTPVGNPSVAAPKPGAPFLAQHESFLKRTKSGPIGLLFLGDSITAGWGKASDVFKKYYDQYQPANFGIGGDRVEHVLWRIQNGELEGITPKVTVLMIGTNNTGVNSGADIAAGIRKLVGEIRTKLPATKVLLLAVFPRGPRSADPKVVEASAAQMKKIDEINTDIAKLDDGKNIRFLDINKGFLVDGKIPNDIMPDQLHPNPKGYQIWADSMQPLLTEMMK